MSETGEAGLSDFNIKEHEAYKAFHNFHKTHLASGGRPAELSDII